MKKSYLKLITIVLCLLFLVLNFPQNTLALSTPSAPKNLSAKVVSSSEIDLEWDSVSTATSYTVYKAKSSSGTYSDIATLETTSYSDTDLTDDTTYYYRVKATNSSGTTSSFSSTVHATTEESYALPAPTELSATAEGSDEIDLEWDSVDEATSYVVYRATSSSSKYNQIATTKTTNYSDTDLLDDTTYYYKVKAKNSSGTSAFSPEDHATTEESDTLSAPKNLTAEVINSSRIDLEWRSVSAATSYYVYRAKSSSDYTKIGKTTSTSYKCNGLSEDTTYYFKVKAVNGSDTSPYSSVVRESTEESDNDLSAPTDLSAKVQSSGEIYLNWDSVSAADSYYVYRATSSSGTYTRIARTTTSSYRDTDLSANTTYYYRVKAVDDSDVSDYSSTVHATANSSSNNSSKIPSARIAGQTLYSTSAEVARSGWTNSYYAIIASGENFSDALCGAPLAKKYDAPILLTAKNSLDDQTKNQLSRLNVKYVYIIGGTGVISSNVEQEILRMGIQVSRIAGNDRYETSLRVAKAMGHFTQAVIATGENFPDALSIAPIAAIKGMPILLTPKNNLPNGLKEYLKDNVRSTYVVGGTGVVSNNVYNQLPSPTRLSGTTRYETNISIIKEFTDDLDFENCYLATGENFPDALAGSALASLTNSPVILVSNSVHQSSNSFIKSKLNTIQKITAFGGVFAVPESILSDYKRT